MSRQGSSATWLSITGPLLRPLSLVYAGALAVRARAYRSGRLPVWRPPVPVVSVGNIRMGGTGKTPVCSRLLDFFAERDLSALLLSRGYGGKPASLPLSVTAETDWRQCGDEPLLLARSHPSARVMVDPDRVRAGRRALAAAASDVILLDDGFQHLAVARDVDLVLLAPADIGREWNSVIPSGPWREDAGALARASALLVNRTGETARPEAFLALLRKKLAAAELSLPVFCFRLEPDGLCRLSGEPADAPLDADYLLFSGVANPHRVAATAAEALGRPPVRHLRYADHHPFSPSDLRRISTLADTRGCRWIVCTMKDAVKLGAWNDPRLAVLKARIVFEEFGGPAFDPWLDSILSRISLHSATEQSTSPPSRDL